MKYLPLPILFSAALALTIAMGAAAPATAQGGGCLGKREIQEAVASGQILSLNDVLAQAGIGRSQEVLNVQVCDQGGRLVYIIGVLNQSGEAQNVVLSAK